MRYLSVEDVLRFNELEVGPGLLADFGLLDSAVFRPQATFGGVDLYPDFIRNHPFVDGNKRTGIGSLEAFCLLNGFELTADDVEIIGLALDIAEGTIAVDAIAGKIRGWLREFVPKEFEAD